MKLSEEVKDCGAGGLKTKWLVEQIAQLEAKLQAHCENEGDECPVCVLEAENEKLQKLEKASIRYYVGEITKEAWRESVRASPEGQRLIALSEQIDTPKEGE